MVVPVASPQLASFGIEEQPAGTGQTCGRSFDRAQRGRITVGRSVKNENGVVSGIRYRKLSRRRVEVNSQRNVQTWLGSLNRADGSRVTLSDSGIHRDGRRQKPSRGGTQSQRCVFVSDHNGYVGFAALRQAPTAVIGDKNLIVDAINVNPLRVCQPRLRPLDEAKIFLIALGCSSKGGHLIDVLVGDKKLIVPGVKKNVGGAVINDKP